MTLLAFASKRYLSADKKELVFSKYYSEMNGLKKIYMQVLFHTKNKQTVDSMTWDELLAYFYLIQQEGVQWRI